MLKGVKVAVFGMVAALAFLSRSLIAVLLFMLTPIGLITAAIVAAFTLLAGATVIIINSWNTLAMAAQQIWTQIEIAIVETIFRILNFILEQFGSVLPAAVTQAIEGALSSTAQFLAELRKRVILEFSGIGDIVSFTIDKIGRETLSLLSNVGKQITKAVIEPFELMPKAANTAVSESNQAFDLMIDKLANVTSSAIGTANAVESIGNAARSAARAVNAIGRVGGGGGGAARPASGGPLPSAFNRGGLRRRFRILLPVPIPLRPQGEDERLINVAEQGAERITAEPLGGGRRGRDAPVFNFEGPVMFDELSLQKFGREVDRVLSREARRTV